MAFELRVVIWYGHMLTGGCGIALLLSGTVAAIATGPRPLDLKDSSLMGVGRVRYGVSGPSFDPLPQVIATSKMAKFWPLVDCVDSTSAGMG